MGAVRGFPLADDAGRVAKPYLSISKSSSPPFRCIRNLADRSTSPYVTRAFRHAHESPSCKHRFVSEIFYETSK